MACTPVLCFTLWLKRVGISLWVVVVEVTADGV